jgi:hypothetical protein
MEEVDQFIKSVFNEVGAENVLAALTTLGAESLDDVRLLDAEAELADVLPVLKRRRLSNCIRVQLIGNGNFSSHFLKLIRSSLLYKSLTSMLY